MTETTTEHRKQAEAMHFASITQRYETRAAIALAALENALARARAEQWPASRCAAEIRRATDDYALAAEALAALGEVAWIATENGGSDAANR